MLCGANTSDDKQNDYNIVSPVISEPLIKPRRHLGALKTAIRRSFWRRGLFDNTLSSKVFGYTESAPPGRRASQTDII
jgi:hypothetical protein